MTTKLFNFKARWLLVPLVLLTIGSGNVWGDTTGQQTSFDAISGKVNGSNDITYSCIQAGGTSAPGIYSSAIRLYQNSTSYAGGVIRIYAASGCTITAVTIGSSMGALPFIIGGVALLGVATAVFFILKKKRK